LISIIIIIIIIRKICWFLLSVFICMCGLNRSTFHLYNFIFQLISCLETREKRNGLKQRWWRWRLVYTRSGNPKHICVWLYLYRAQKNHYILITSLKSYQTNTFISDEPRSIYLEIRFELLLIRNLFLIRMFLIVFILRNAHRISKINHGQSNLFFIVILYKTLCYRWYRKQTLSEN
jgi:hypothetical protein